MKQRLLLVLSTLFLLDLFRFGLKVVPHFLVIVLVAYLSDYLLIRFRKVPPFFPLAALVSGAIAAFVLDPSTSLILKILTPLIAVASKHYLRKGEDHIFNPAAFGLFVGAALGASISWWVGDSGWLADAVLITGMFFILRRLRRLKIALSFLLTFFALRLLVYQEFNFWFSLLFFPLVMLPEPMTSPADPKEQLVSGALAAFFLVFFGFSRLVFIDSFLQSLLLLNLLFRLGLTKKIIEVFQL